MSKAILEALEALEAEKGIKKEVVIEALEVALISAYKRHYGQAQNVEIVFREKKGDIKVYSIKKVVEEVNDTQLEISLEDALRLNPHYELEDKIKFEMAPKDFGRIAAQTAKQVIMQRIREESRQNIYNEYIRYENEIVSGTVERKDSRYVYVNLGNVEAIMSQKDRMPNENYESHDRIKVFLYRVNNGVKGPFVFVSRSHPELLKRLFEQEVPEIYEGIVEIKNVAREAGNRAKIAVYSNDENIDPVGTTVGARGARVQAIVSELHGENMDIIEWSKDPAEFIANALKPSEVVDVVFDLENPHAAVVIVPDDQLSLAIGKRGQNVRLAARLTGYKIDIKRESEQDEFWEEYDAKKLKLDGKEEVNLEENEAASEVEETDFEIEDDVAAEEMESELVEVIADEENRATDVDEELTNDHATEVTPEQIAEDIDDEVIAEIEEDMQD
ncbi:MAG: transcription termination factor NusA [Lactobacillales bacterium]|jgi:N utilization substance protein A|nr:transcription termination factor NusA [Lactobacillales bacterium]